MQRRVLIGVLFVLTVVVGAAAVYVGIQLQAQPDTTPEETAAAAGDGRGLIDINTGAQHEWSPAIGCVQDDDTYGMHCFVQVNYPGNLDLDPQQNSEPWRFTCDGRVATCLENRQTNFIQDGGRRIMPVLRGDESCGQTIQVDVCPIGSSGPCDSAAAWIVFYTGDCATPPAECGATCTESGCTAGNICDVATNTCVNAGCSQNPDICDQAMCAPSINECGDRCWGEESEWANCASGYTCGDVGSDGFGVCMLDECYLGTADCSADMCTAVTPTPTPTPSITTTIVDTPSPTPTFTSSSCSESCDPSGSSDQCGEGHICADHDNDGNSTCVLTVCSQGELTCSPDGCIENTPTPTPTPSITTVITDVLECYETGCDDVGNSCVSGLTCIDNRCVSAAYPDSADCKPGDVPVTTLPPTALISDEADRVLIAFILILAGVTVYTSGAGRSAGDYLWNGIRGMKPRTQRDFENEAMDSINDES